MISEDILSELIDDINGKTITVSNKTITVKSLPSKEYQDFEQPTVSITINPYSRGYGGMGKLKSVDSDGKYTASQAMKADVELRVSAGEMRKGAVIIHPKYITEAVMNMVKKRVLVAWQRILVQHAGAVKDDAIKTERDFSDFEDGSGKSKRFMRIEVEYEDTWNYLLDGEVPDSHPVRGIRFYTKNENGTDEDKPTLVMDE